MAHTKPEKISLGERGRVNYVALFNLATVKELRTTKQYKEKILRQLEDGKPLPDRFIKILSKKREKVLELKTDTPVKIKIPSKYKNAKPGKHKYYWIKLKLSKSGNVYYQSFVGQIGKKIEKQLNDYIKFFVKKYDNLSIYVHTITIQKI